MVMHVEKMRRKKTPTQAEPKMTKRALERMKPPSTWLAPQKTPQTTVHSVVNTMFHGWRSLT